MQKNGQAEEQEWQKYLHVLSALPSEDRRHMNRHTTGDLYWLP